MTHPHPRALEAAARAAMNAWEAIPDCPGKMYGQEAEAVARAAVTAYLAEAGDGWMPIETAPKATYPETEIRILLWGPSFKNMTVIGWWRPTGENDGLWFTAEDEGGIGWGECKPTHWRPLPAPPAAQEKK